MVSFDLSHVKDADLIRNLEFGRPAIIEFDVLVRTDKLRRLRKVFEKRGEYLTDAQILERALDLFIEQSRARSR